MHTTKIAAIVSSIVLSFIILMTSVQMSSYNLYHTPSITGFDIAENNVPSDKIIAISQLSKKERREVECLAQNIYHEAAYEPRLGWIAVASVTMNRLISGNYADTVCGVVHQKSGSTYQFSWVGAANRLSQINQEVYNDILNVATLMYLDYEPSKDVTGGSTFYHADYVNPRWKLEKVKKIGRHIFYRSKKDTELFGDAI